MYKIGDFSKLGQVSTRMLRHYDQLGLLVPNQTDKWTGYRYYTVEQLARLNRIIALKELGFSLEQIAHLLDSHQPPDAQQLRGMLLLRQGELEQELLVKQMQLREVESRLRQIEQEGQPSPYEIVVKGLEPVAVAAVRQVVPHLAQMNFYCLRLYQTLYAELAAAGIRPLAPEITLYHTDEYRETDVEVETAVVIPTTYSQPPHTERLTCRELPPADLAAALIYEGSFNDITGAVLELLRWIGLHRHVPAGPLRELHLSGPAHVNGVTVETAVIELQLPIAPFRL